VVGGVGLGDAVSALVKPYRTLASAERCAREVSASSTIVSKPDHQGNLLHLVLGDAWTDGTISVFGARTSGRATRAQVNEWQRAAGSALVLRSSTRRTESAEWRFAADPTHTDERAVGCELVTHDGRVLAACLWSGGDLDIDSDGCGVRPAGVEACLTPDSVDWPAESVALAAVWGDR
jgi:hypothetical protein